MNAAKRVRSILSRQLASLTVGERIYRQNCEVCHGVIGEGLNDYDAIFTRLARAGFAGWISVEDGMNGLDELRRSVSFLRGKRAEHYGAAAD